ncbi:tachykinins-like [Anopheles bellator]|uniref:tachykinins-like n=1 Tax=Anopheles bellator TaxID=139047 RepID=UPI00264A2A4F|nr:tachykinins-like [Anopheles bellator]
MNASIAVLTLTCLFKVCVAAQDLPIETADDGRINYISLTGNGYTDSDLPSVSSASPIGDAGDGLTQGLLRWTSTAEAKDLLPRLLRRNPDLLDSLSAALASDGELINEQDNMIDQPDDVLTGHHAKDEGFFEGYDSMRNSYPKRAPTGFNGMRGRRIPSGFNGVRGKKSFYSWRSHSIPGSQNSYKDGKRAPSGFLGMRGKKSFDMAQDQRWRMDDLFANDPPKEYPSYLILDPTLGPSLHINPAPPKRVPNGFMGLRGKKDCC